MSKKISVLIATKNRLSQLYQCVYSLNKGSYNNYEIVIVDQTKYKKINRKILKKLLLIPTVRYHHLNSSGKTVALNKALKLATGDIFAFTDDDCILSGDWLQVINLLFEKYPSVTGVYGKTLPFNPEDHCGLICPSTFTNTNDTEHFIKNQTYHHNVGIGNNMAYRAIFFNELKFKEWLGPGSIAKQGDDVGIMLEAFNKGCQLLYSCSAIAYHNRWINESKNEMLDAEYLCGEFAAYSYFYKDKQNFVNEILRTIFANLLLSMKNYFVKVIKLKKKGLYGIFFSIIKIIFIVRGTVIGNYYKNVY